MGERGQTERINGIQRVAMSGRLCLTFSGSQYHGDVAEGEKRHGQGVMYFPTGAWYEGSWKHDQMHGTCGRYCFANVCLLGECLLTPSRGMYTRELSRKTLLTEKGNCSTRTATTMRGNGRTGLNMDMGSMTLTPWGYDIRVTGVRSVTQLLLG